MGYKKIPSHIEAFLMRERNNHEPRELSIIANIPLSTVYSFFDSKKVGYKKKSGCPVEKIPTSFDRPPAVYSNPQWHEIYK